MKANKYVKDCGPYYVESYSQGAGMVYMQLYPAFPQYDLTTPDKDTDDDWRKEPRWAIHRFHREGGGPSIFSSMALARTLSEFLNSVYPEHVTQGWTETISALKKEKEENDKLVECEKCCTITFAPRDWKFCPVCGHKVKISANT